MFQLKHSDEDLWEVSAAGRLVFTGTMRQVEDWLDYQDNSHRPQLRQTPNRISMAFRRLTKWLAGQIAHHPRPRTA